MTRKGHTSSRHPSKGVWKEADSGLEMAAREGRVPTHATVKQQEPLVLRGGADRASIRRNNSGCLQESESEHEQNLRQATAGHGRRTYNPQRNQLHSRGHTIVGPTSVSQGCLNAVSHSPEETVPSKRETVTPHNSLTERLDFE